jgi:hypothetical protein
MLVFLSESYFKRKVYLHTSKAIGDSIKSEVANAPGMKLAKRGKASVTMRKDPMESLRIVN